MGETARRALRRALRAIARLAVAGVVIALFVGSSFVGLLVHLDLPAGRRLTASLLSELLSTTFYGTVEVGSVDRLTLQAFTARDVVVKDEYGNQVLVLSEVRARASVPDILSDLVFEDEKVTIVIRHVRVESAEAQIITDPTTSEPTIARALTPVPGEPKKPGEPEEPGRYLRVWLPVIEVGRGYARGRIGESPTLETQLTAARGSVLVTPKGAAVDVERFGMIARGVGGTDAEGTAELHIRAPGAIWSSFDGHLGNVQIDATLQVHGSRITTTVDIPRARHEDVRALLPDWPLREDVSAHAEATGVPPLLDTSGRFEIGEARVTASGPMRLAGGFTLDLDAQGRDIDLRAVLPDAPPTRIDVDTALSIYDKDGTIVVDVNGTTQPTKIAGEPIPATDVTGSVANGQFNGKATLHEKGMPMKVGVTIHRDGAIDLDVHARRFSVQGAPRLRQYTNARGYVDLRVKGRIENKRLEADVEADVDNLAMGDVRLAQGRITGHARGPIDQPRRLDIDARLSGRRGTAGGFSFDEVTAKAQGPVTRPRVRAALKDRYGPNVEASGVVATTAGPRIEGLELVVSREDARLTGKIESIDVSGGRVEIKDLRMSGAGGELRGWVRIRPKLLEAKVEGDDLDLEVLARTFGLPRGIAGGKLRVRADVSAGSDVQRGEVFIALGNGTVAGLGGISLRLRARLEDKALTGDLGAQVMDIGAVGATWDTTLAGHVLEVESWRDMIGQARLNLSRIELANLLYLLPASARIEEIKGTAFADLELKRRLAAALPTVVVRHAGTQGLEVVRAPPEGEEEEKPLVIDGLDLRVSGELSGETGEATGTTLVFYGNEVLGSASGTARVDLVRLMKAPLEIGKQMLEMPVDAVLALNTRSAASLPPYMRPAGVAGDVGARLQMKGTPANPSFQLSAKAAKLVAGGGREVVPVDVHVDASYEKSSGDFRGTARVEHRGNPVAASAHVQGNADWDDLTGPPTEGRPAWTASAQLVFRGLPLGVFAPLAGRRVSGELWDSASFERHGELPNVRGSVQLKNVKIDDVSVGTGRLTVTSNARVLRGNISFANAGGSFKLGGLAALRWEGLAPSIDDSRPLEMSLDAKNFDAVVLSPVLSDVLAELKGTIQAGIRARLQRVPVGNDPEKKEWRGEVTGTASMRKGIVQIRALGMELTDVNFDAVARDSHPYSLIQIRKLSAKARKGDLKAAANLYLLGIDLVRANGEATLNSVPLIVEGVPQAYATGALKLTLARHEKEMYVEVSVSDRVKELTAVLPRSSDRSTIGLDENEDIVILQALKEPEEPSAGGGLPWRISFATRNRVRIVRHDINLRIGGEPEIIIAEKADVRGVVELQRGGHMLLMGSKDFTIEEGRIRFDTGDASNPSIFVLATWLAPDGTLLRVRVIGTFEKPEVRLESDPPRTEAEKFALLLGGRADDAEDDSAGGAAGAGLGLGASKLNELFEGGILGDSVEFRAGTTADDRTSYTAAYRVSESVWIEGTYRARDVNSGGGPGEQRPDISTTVDYRFKKDWSLRSEIGLLGGQLDLLWQHRY
jgi:hypothetical protein